MHQPERKFRGTKIVHVGSFWLGLVGLSFALHVGDCNQYALGGARKARRHWLVYFGNGSKDDFRTSRARIPPAF